LATAIAGSVHQYNEGGHQDRPDQERIEQDPKPEREAELA
jgi:hypothetical protein